MFFKNQIEDSTVEWADVDKKQTVTQSFICSGLLDYIFKWVVRV